MDDEGMFLTESQLAKAEGLIDLENQHCVMDQGQSFSIHLKTNDFNFAGLNQKPSCSVCSHIKVILLTPI